MKRIKSALLLSAFAAAALFFASCAPAPNSQNNGNQGAVNTPANPVTLTFRLWDEQAQSAYVESLAAFEQENPEIQVRVELVSWANYWNQLPLDVAAGEAPDVYLMNSSNFALLADEGRLVDVGATLGDNHDDWVPAASDIYTRDGTLWGVPQFWDSIALYYNKDLVSAAGVDPSNLTWNIGGDGDTLLPALRKLTQDSAGNRADTADFMEHNVAVYGMNAQADMQAIYLDFLAQAGANYQDPQSGEFAFASPEGEAAFRYLADLINVYHVAPPASETNINGDISRDMFMRGELALYQSGPYNLKTIADNVDFSWGITPMIAGPRGRISVVHAVAAVGNAQSQHPQEVAKLLGWLGSARGQAPLAEQGVAFPAVATAGQGFVDYWAERGVNVQPFIEAATGEYSDGVPGGVTPPPRGRMINSGAVAAEAVFKDILAGNMPGGLREAQEAGNIAMRE